MSTRRRSRTAQVDTTTTMTITTTTTTTTTTAAAVLTEDHQITPNPKRSAKSEASPPSSSSRKKARTTGRKSAPRRARSEGTGGASSSAMEEVKIEGESEAIGDEDDESRLVGDPIPMEEAKKRWPDRYNKKKKEGSRSSNSNQKKDDSDDDLLAKCHYRKAIVDGCDFDLGDDTYVKGKNGNFDYIARIVELFEAADGGAYFTAQWFFKAEDTVIKDHASLVDSRRVFFSKLKNVNPIDSITSKIKIVQVSPNIDLATKKASIPPCDFYYDMEYSLSYSTFSNLPPANGLESEMWSSTVSTDACSDSGGVVVGVENNGRISASKTDEMTLLDLYSGCGGMSTGLCIGAANSGVNLVTRWAVDFNEYACETLKKNHRETEVRNESAESFLSLLKEWRKLCAKFSLLDSQHLRMKNASIFEDDDVKIDDTFDTTSEEFEVEKLVGICYGDPNEIKKTGLYFKVRWKGYGPSHDTWEPVSGLNNCKERIEEFVQRGYRYNILPLPGEVDVICGGPPCQGISGFNRFRNKAEPLNDPKNYQLVVFMDIVQYLKPRFVLMENVVDIVKFAGGFLIRYAIGRLSSLDYQSRLGMMVAGCYGLPQFRMRVFLWGALPTEKLPPFPLPTHEVVVRGVTPAEFEGNVVAYDENHKLELEKALLLGDAISDLPPVQNDETRDEMPYGGKAHTDFQKFIRSSKNEMMGIKASSKEPTSKAMLYDHLPFKLNIDDYQRVCQVPKRKKACFRDLPGVLVSADNKVEWDPKVERVYLPSGKPLVPDYAMSWKDGFSVEPFGRLWWDEIVPTVVTRAQPHNRVITHPEQDRVLTVRENARLQGFPDFYKFCGPIKERYKQVGNAVAVPAGRALGYVLGLALQGSCSDQPLFTLPSKFLRPGDESEAVVQ